MSDVYAQSDCPDCNHWQASMAELRREIGVLQQQLTRERNDNAAQIRTLVSIREQLEAARCAWAELQR
jgi:chromosome segregation ATPase